MKVERRTIVPAEPFDTGTIAPGVTWRRLYPGGLAGPNGETANAIPGGQTWSEIVMLGTGASDFIYAIPDIRLPPNQLWPMHWHDCWTVVVILEGGCTIGDWFMQPGDVFVAAPSVEYGPLLIGPGGCRLLEIFGDLALSPGGYGPEYRDHPTLLGGEHVFREREGANRRNEGRSSVPLDGVEGLWKSRLEPGWQWFLGDRDDPDCPLVRGTRLPVGEAIEATRREDWYAALILEGSVEVGERTLVQDDLLIAEPGSLVPAMAAGSEGAHLLENFRTSRAFGNPE